MRQATSQWCAFVHASVRPSVHPPARPSVHSFIRPSIRPYVHRRASEHAKLPLVPFFVSLCSIQFRFATVATTAYAKHITICEPLTPSQRRVSNSPEADSFCLMSSPGPVSVAHTSGEELNGSFIHYPNTMELCGVMPNGTGLSANTNGTGSPGRKRTFARSVSSTLSDSDGDASEDKSMMEWSTRSNIRDPGAGDEEQSESQLIADLRYRSAKFRLLHNKDRAVPVNPGVRSQFEVPNVAAFDHPPERPSSFGLNVNEDQTPFGLGTEEVAEFGTNGGKLTLWQFLLELLLSNKYRNLIRWTNKKGEFILLQAEAVAKLWGLYKDRNHRMNYDKLSRALRYYYEKNIIRKVHGHKFVYQFMGLRNLIKMCQEASTNSIASRPSLEPITDCSPHENKPNSDWELPTGTTLHLNTSQSCTFPRTDLLGINPSAVHNINDNIDRLGQITYPHNRLVTETGVRGLHPTSLDNFIDRWSSVGNQADSAIAATTTTITTTISSSSANTNTVVRSNNQAHQSPGSDENSLLKESHPETPDSTNLPQPFVDSNPDVDSNLNERASDFSNLLCSLASAMSAGHWIPRIADQASSAVPFDLSTSMNLLTKPAPTNLLLNPMTSPLWMTQVMQSGRESSKSNEQSHDKEVNNFAAGRSETFSSVTQQTSKSPISLLDTSDTVSRLLRSRDRLLVEETTLPVQPTPQTEHLHTKTVLDPISRSISPECHCSCHTSNTWTLLKPLSITTTNTNTVNTTSTVISSGASSFLTGPPLSGFTSTNFQSDPTKSQFPRTLVNPVRETSPTKLHHQRHAINMQRLGEQLSLISRSCHPHSISKPNQATAMNSATPGNNSTSSSNLNHIPTSQSVPPMSTARVPPLLPGLQDSVPECIKSGYAFGCGCDPFARIPATVPPSCSPDGEPCVWMPVPVTMLTSWIRLLSGLAVPTEPDSQSGDVGHEDPNGSGQSEPELNSMGLIQSNLFPPTSVREPFSTLKSEPRDGGDQFNGV